MNTPDETARLVSKIAENKLAISEHTIQRDAATGDAVIYHDIIIGDLTNSNIYLNAQLE